MYSKIVNPETNRLVNINGQMGQQILRNYLNVLRGGMNRGPRRRHTFSNSAEQRDRTRESTSGAFERSVQADLDAREDDAADAQWAEDNAIIRKHLGRSCPFCNPVDLSKMGRDQRQAILDEAADEAANWEADEAARADWEAGEAAAGHAYSYDDEEEADASTSCFADCADATSAKCTTCVEDFQDKVAPGFRAMCNIMGA